MTPAASDDDSDANLDDVDGAFIDSLMPEGSVPLGFVAVLLWVDGEGEQRWRCYSQMDTTVTTTLGLLELAKLDVVARSDTGLPIQYPEGTDDPEGES